MELSLCKSTVTEAMEKNLCGFSNPENSWTISFLNEEHDEVDHRILGLEGPNLLLIAQLALSHAFPYFLDIVESTKDKWHIKKLKKSLR